MVWAGAYVTKLLGDMGAEIVKVEAPSNMDLIRGLNLEAGGEYYNTSPYFNTYNRNKLGVGLDVGKPEGLALFKRLVRISDVVVENYRTDVSEKLGITYDALRQVNPGIIMLSMQAYGRSGPHRNYAGYGPMSEYMGGLTSMSGYANGEPQKVGISYGDPLAGVAGAGAIVGALLYRRRTGKGQNIELAQRENVMGFLGEAVLDWSMNRNLRKPQGNRHDAYAPHGCYASAGDDQWVAIAVTSDEEWRRFCAAVGRHELAEDPRFADAASRKRNEDALDAIVEAWTKTRTKEEAFQVLGDAGVPVGKMMDPNDLLNDPHLKAREFYQPMSHPAAGTWPMDGPVWRMSRTPGKFWRPAPTFGQHNDYVLQELLGLAHGEIAALEERQVVARKPVTPSQV
jgi:crotonobetainyl-CoA:carnitine CoA-transferase CaiB-like acyl-CoA transferase